MPERGKDLEAWRRDVERARRADRLNAARRLRDVPPEVTLHAAFDLTEFTADLHRVGA